MSTSFRTPIIASTSIMLIGWSMTVGSPEIERDAIVADY
jgi:hypothetical protein